MCTLQLPYKITSSLDGYNELSRLYFNMAELVEHNKEVKVDFSLCKEFDGNSVQYSTGFPAKQALR